MTILSNEGNWLMRSERIFDILLDDVGRWIIIAFVDAGLYGEFLSYIEEDHMKDVQEIWSNLVHAIIDEFPPEKLREIRGNFEDAIKEVKARGAYLKDLASLLKKRKIIAVYM
jgi:hypothetical protein